MQQQALSQTVSRLRVDETIERCFGPATLRTEIGIELPLFEARPGLGSRKVYTISITRCHTDLGRQCSME